MALEPIEIDSLARRFYDGGLGHGSEDFAHWALRQITDLLGIAEVSWSRENGRMQQVDEVHVGTPAREPDSGAGLTFALPGANGNAWHRFQFRQDSGPFSDADASEIKRLAAFLIHADWMHRQIVQTRMSGALRKIDGQAILDQAGQIMSCDDAFTDLMGNGYPQWTGTDLPVAIDWNTASGRSGQALNGLKLFASRLGEFVQVRLCRAQSHDNLSPREIEVAKLIARGRTFKEAARELSLAPSTVSTHLYSLYNKLEIKGRSELIDWLSAQRDWI